VEACRLDSLLETCNLALFVLAYTRARVCVRRFACVCVCVCVVSVCVSTHRKRQTERCFVCVFVVQIEAIQPMHMGEHAQRRHHRNLLSHVCACEQVGILSMCLRVCLSGVSPV